jgi:hypothetical protein
VIVKDHDDHVVADEPILQLQQAGHCRPCRVAGEDALLPCDAARHQRGVLVRDLLEVIDDVEVDVLRQEVLADAFGDVRVDFVLVEDAGLFVLLEHRSVGVDPPHFDLRVAFLEITANAADRAAGAYANDEVGDPPVRLFPDLRSGLLVVRGGVRKVVVLVGFPGIRNFTLQPGGHRVIGARIFGIDVGRADDHLRAERLEGIDLLLGLLVGGRKDAAIALHHGGDGQPHSGVAGGPLDDRAARLQQTGPLGVFDHSHRHPVLDRVAGIEGFELCQHRSVDHTVGDSIDADHRRVADDIEDRAGNRGQRHTHDVT